MKIQFPLKYFLLTITISLVLVVGGSIGWTSHTTMKQILDSSTLSNSQSIRKELTVTLQAENNQAISAISVLSHHPDLVKDSPQDKIVALPMLADLLSKIPNLESIYVGDSNGTYFLLRKLRTAADHKRFMAPNHCAYVMQIVQNNVSVHTLFDKDLNKISSHIDQQTNSYDPRKRPWYKMAENTDTLIQTPVYTFFTARTKGYTLSKRMQLGSNTTNNKISIIAADIRVDYLEKKLDSLKPTPNSKLALADDKGNIIAGTVSDEQHYLQHIKKPNIHNKDFHQRSFYSVDKISAVSGMSYYLILDIPNADIFWESKSLYQTQAIIISLLLLLGIYVSLRFSENLSHEIQQLSEKIYNVRTFNFSKYLIFNSRISEIKRLSDDIEAVSSSVHAFKSLTYHISSAKTADKMVASALKDILYFTEIPTAILFTRKEDSFIPFKGVSRNKEISTEKLQQLSSISKLFLSSKALEFNLTIVKDLKMESSEFYNIEKYGNEVLLVPLSNRDEENNGVLVFLSHEKFKFHKKKFIKDLSPYLSLSLETKFNIDKQKELFDAFIHIIANSIDAKNPATANHCIRVPDLTSKLAQATCQRTTGKFANFDLNDDEWEMLYIASWLHDCGKITTPEYVLDKATKLETVHNRIHEIRMRFEILKHEKELDYWKAIATNSEADYAKLQTELDKVSEDFYFIARCNLAGKPLQDADLARIDAIAEQTWTATLDDSLGLSLSELKRRDNKSKIYPRKEKLLEDKQEHKIERYDSTSYPQELGIKLQPPKYLYDRGELANIKIRRGTLTDEERFKINEHVIQSLLMLSALPLPKHLSQIPDWAASHHERMDGNGYPRNLSQNDMHPVARMIAIADVYEALTAHDRPYKTNKSHQESINIMSQMAQEGHLDADLFEIFINDCSFDEI